MGGLIVPPGTYGTLGATQSPTAADALRTLAALYGFDGANLARLDARALAGTTNVSGLNALLANTILRAPNNDAGDDGAGAPLVTFYNLAGTALLAGGFMAYAGLWNGSTWDRKRANVDGGILASAARTATTNSVDLTNYNAKGAIVELNVSVNPGAAETLQILVQGKAPTSGNYYTLSDGGAQAFGGAAGTRRLLVYPGAGAAANGIDVVNGYPLPRTWRARVVHSAAGSWTYSVSVSYIN